MTSYQYKQVTNKAYECGSVKYTLHKTQNVLTENFGKNLNPPAGYKGLTIIDAYFEGYNK